MKKKKRAKATQENAFTHTYTSTHHYVLLNSRMEIINQIKKNAKEKLKKKIIKKLL